MHGKGYYKNELAGKLLGQDPLFEAVARVKQHAEAGFPILTDVNLDNVAHFEIIGDRAYGAFVRFKDLKGYPGRVGQERAAPAPRPKGADGGQG
jgi:hypothetical protein